MNREGMVQDYTNERIAEEEAARCQREQVYCHQDDAIYVDDVDQYATPDADTLECEWTNRMCFSNDMYYIDVEGCYVSQQAYENDGRTCDDCSATMHCDDAHRRGDNCYCLSCYENLAMPQPESTREGYVHSTEPRFIPSIKQDTVRIPSGYDDLMVRHYEDDASGGYYVQWDIDYMNKFKDYHITNQIQRFDSNLTQQFTRIYDILASHNTEHSTGYNNVGVLGPYVNVQRYPTDTKSASHNIIVEYRDAMGNVKKREEPVNKIFDYAERLGISYITTKSQSLKADIHKGIIQTNRVLSNKVECKLQYFDTSINSCQFNGCDAHSMGLADLFTNDCNLLLLVGNNNLDPLKDRHEGRALVRVMYDDDGEEYLFFDRFYATGGLANNYHDTLAMIITDVIQMGYKVVVSDRSEHGTSNKSILTSYKNNSVFDVIHMNKSLRQPARKVLFNDAAYYSDSGVVTFTAYENAEKYFRDKIKAEYTFLVTLKQDA